MKLAVGAKVSLKTAEKWLKGGVVTEANNEALLRASAKLGVFRETKSVSEPDHS